MTATPLRPSDPPERGDAWTPGPWPIEFTGDGKRIVVGASMVEGPNGYDIAEVYSDDCPSELAEANARLIAAAPDLYEALEPFVQALMDCGDEPDDRREYADRVNIWESPVALGITYGDFRRARAALSRARGEP